MGRSNGFAALPLLVMSGFLGIVGTVAALQGFITAHNQAYGVLSERGPSAFQGTGAVGGGDPVVLFGPDHTTASLAHRLDYAAPGWPRSRPAPAICMLVVASNLAGTNHWRQQCDSN